MWSSFMDQVCTKNACLADLVAKEEFYRPLWTNYLPMATTGNGARGGGARGGGGGTASGSTSHPDSPAEVARQINSLVQQNQRLQQHVDRIHSDQRRQQVPVFRQPDRLPGTSNIGLSDAQRRGGTGGVGNGDGGGGNGWQRGGNGNGNNNDSGGGGRGGDGGGRRRGGGGDNNNSKDEINRK